jgi:hypothetical protein
MKKHARIANLARMKGQKDIEVTIKIEQNTERVNKKKAYLRKE